MFCNIFFVERKEISTPVGGFSKPCKVIDADGIDTNIMLVINVISGFPFIDFLMDLLGSEYSVTVSEGFDVRKYFIEGLDENAHGVGIVDDSDIR